MGDKKVLILKDLSFYLPKEVLEVYRKKGIYFIPTSKNISFIFRVIRKFLNKINIYPSILNGNWVKLIHEFDKIILFDNASSKDPVAKYINNRIKEDVSLYYYYWNPIFVANSTEYIKQYASKFKLYSFDERDVLKYNIEYNTTIYSKYIILKNCELEYDIYFVGKEKGRFKIIKELEDIFNAYDLKFYNYIITKENNLPRVSAEDNLNNISKSKAILDILQKGQSGLTLRVLESIFLKKKLISNNLALKEYKFYNPNNIFIIGYDDYKDLNEFISSPYVDISQEIVYYYDIEEWIMRFK